MANLRQAQLSAMEAASAEQVLPAMEAQAPTVLPRRGPGYVDVRSGARSRCGDPALARCGVCLTEFIHFTLVYILVNVKWINSPQFGPFWRLYGASQNASRAFGSGDGPGQPGGGDLCPPQAGAFHEQALARQRTLCAKARILINRATSRATWFGRQASAAQREAAVTLVLRCLQIAPWPAVMLTIYEAAAWLGVGYERVHDYVSEGRLPAAKFGSVWYVQVTDVQAFQRRPTGRPGGAR